MILVIFAFHVIEVAIWSVKRVKGYRTKYLHHEIINAGANEDGNEGANESFNEGGSKGGSEENQHLDV
ncbi:hypothetical protein ACE6H2_026747 [Prunus campanulata]